MTEALVGIPGELGLFFDEVNSALAQERLIVWLEEQFGELCLELNQLPNDESAGQLRCQLGSSPKGPRLLRPRSWLAWASSKSICNGRGPRWADWLPLVRTDSGSSLR